MTDKEDQAILSAAAKIWGKRGGEARAKKLTKKQRSAAAKKAAAGRKTFGRKPSCVCGECPTCYNRLAQQRHRDKVLGQAKGKERKT